MQTSAQKQTKLYLEIILAILVVILVILCVLLVQEYHRLRSLNYIAGHESLLTTLRAQGPLDAKDVSYIETWMTFDYVNHLFNIPPSYLETTLGITDSRYPRLTVGEYLERENPGETASSLTQVRSAVGSYLTAQQ
jgi:hypothetical protein